MFKELYTMIDDLHTITNSAQFKRMLYRHATSNKYFLPSQEMLDAGGGPTSKRFAELYIKTMEKQLARKPNP